MSSISMVEHQESVNIPFSSPILNQCGMERSTSSVIWISKSFYWSIGSFSDVCGLDLSENENLLPQEYRCLLDIDSILSPTFSVGSADEGTLCRWIIKLVKSDPNKIDLHMELTQSETEIGGERLLPYECYFKYQIHVLGANGCPVYSKENKSIVFLKSEKSWCEPAFFTLDFLRERSNELIHDDTLTLRVDLRVLSDLHHSRLDEFNGSPSSAGGKRKKKDFAPDEWYEAVSLGQQSVAQKTLQNMWKSGKDSDAVIECSGKQFQIHKSVLSGASPVFAAAFSHDMCEKTENRMVISDIAPETFEVLLRFIYFDVSGDESEWESVDGISSLLNAAEKYQILSLKSLCFQKLCHNLSLNNVAKACVLVNLFRPEDEAIEKFIYSYLLKNIGLVRKTEEFQKKVKEVPEAFTPLLMLILPKISFKIQCHA